MKDEKSIAGSGPGRWVVYSIHSVGVLNITSRGFPDNPDNMRRSRLETTLSKQGSLIHTLHGGRRYVDPIETGVVLASLLPARIAQQMLDAVKLWRSFPRFHNSMGKRATPTIIPCTVRTRALLITPPIRFRSGSENLIDVSRLADRIRHVQPHLRWARLVASGFTHSSPFGFKLNTSFAVTLLVLSSLLNTSVLAHMFLDEICR